MASPEPEALVGALPLEAAAEPSGTVGGRSPWRLARERLRNDRVAMVSAVVIVLIVLAALGAPLVAHLLGHGPNQQFRDTGLTEEGIPVGPNRSFFFGTDELGRDVFLRVLYGARISLLAGVAASGIAVVIGVVIGLAAGYFGGIVDSVLARFMDVVLSLPYLVFAIALVSLVGPSLLITIVVIAMFSWASVGRVVRGQALACREREFVESARALGAGNLRIMFIDILPNVLGPAIVYATMLIPLSIVFEATLSFLGVGVLPPTATWGNMLAESLPFYRVAWWFVVFPGLALLVTTVAFNLLGDSVRDALDPRGPQGRFRRGGRPRG